MKRVKPHRYEKALWNAAEKIKDKAEVDWHWGNVHRQYLEAAEACRRYDKDRNDRIVAAEKASGGDAHEAARRLLEAMQDS